MGRHAAVDHIKEQALQLGGNRTALARADRPVVEFADRRHLGGGAGEESLVGDVDVVARQALENGYDEALLLDVDGFVAEGAGENVFIVKDGVIYEPEIASALVGITRATILTLAKELGIAVVSKRLTRDDIYIADEAFFTGTAAEVTPIRELDNRTIGAGRRGPITTKLQSLFFDVVNGKVPAHADWLTPVA